MLKWVKDNLSLILAISALLGFLVHVHDDYKRMQYDQQRHETEIKELQSNMTRTYGIIAGVANQLSSPK